MFWQARFSLYISTPNQPCAHLGTDSPVLMPHVFREEAGHILTSSIAHETRLCDLPHIGVDKG